MVHSERSFGDRLNDTLIIYRPKYDKLRHNNRAFTYLWSDENAADLELVYKLGGNTEGVVTFDLLGPPMIGYICASGIWVGIVLLLFGPLMIEILYAGLVLIALSIIIICIIVNSQQHVCIMDLADPSHFYVAYYSTIPKLKLNTIWKYTYDDTPALNHTRQEGEYTFNTRGAIVPRN